MSQPVQPLTPEQYKQWEATQMAMGRMLTHEQMKQRELAQAQQQAMQMQQPQNPSFWQQARNFSLLEALRGMAQPFMGQRRQEYQEYFDRRNDPDQYTR